MKRIIGLFVLISIVSCSSHTKRRYEKQLKLEKAVADNSKNSLNWQGKYRGVLPCADCEGIQTEITLNKNGTYEIARMYEGKSTEVFLEKGSYRWFDNGSKITFYSANNSTDYSSYLVGENKLIKLDNSSNKIVSEYAEMYILNKVGFDNRIVEKYWRLIELNGAGIEEPEFPRVEIYFKLKLLDSKVIGFAGCNNFSGNFELMADNRIMFSKMMNTLRTCRKQETENLYLKVFEKSDNYKIKNDTLMLTKGRMPALAKFVAVYMK